MKTNYKRFYPKKKINYQSNDFINKINFESLKNNKWNFLKLKILKNYNVNTLSTKFEKKWLRRRFNEELRIKQALKFYYGPIREKTFRNYLLKSLSNKSEQNSQEILIQNLEVRLDRFLTRSGVFCSIFKSRQNILHKKIWLCKSKDIKFYLIDKPNYAVQVGDLFKLKGNYKFKDIEFNYDYFKIFQKGDFIYLLVIKKPSLNEINFSFKLNLKEVFNWGRRY